MGWCDSLGAVGFGASRGIVARPMAVVARPPKSHGAPIGSARLGMAATTERSLGLTEQKKSHLAALATRWDRSVGLYRANGAM